MRTEGSAEASGASAAPALAALLAARTPGFTPNTRLGGLGCGMDATLRDAMHGGSNQDGFTATRWSGASPRDHAPSVPYPGVPEERTATPEATSATPGSIDAGLDRPAVASGAQVDAHASELARARDDGFTAGFHAGRDAAEVELGASVAELDRLAGALVAARAIDAPALAEALAQTVHALLAELLDECPDLAAHGVETRARRALETFATPCVLWLAPPDAAALATPLARSGLSIVPDPTLARGALRLTNATSRLDDSPAARLDRLAPMLAEAAAHAAAHETQAQRAA